MKILQITPSLYNGGGEIFAFQLSEALANRGHDVRLLSVTQPDPRSPLFQRLSSAPFDFVSLNKVSGRGVDFRIPFKIFKNVLNWKPDVIHTHLRALAYSSLATPLAGAKFHTVHSLAQKECSRNTQKLYRLLFRAHWKPVAISEVVGESISEVYGVPSPLVDNGVKKPPSSSGEIFRFENGIRPDAKVIVHVGRLSDTKNQLGLLNAFARLSSCISDVHLVSVGNDPAIGEPYKLRLMAELNVLPPDISSRVHLLGVRSDIGNILSAADVFVLCSRYEGMPLSLLEAMSLGMKCVCTRVGGIPDAIDQSSGWLVPPNDEAALVQALHEAVEDQGGERGQQARSVFDARFSIERCAEAYEALYLQASGANR